MVLAFFIPSMTNDLPIKQTHTWIASFGFYEGISQHPESKQVYLSQSKSFLRNPMTLKAPLAHVCCGSIPHRSKMKILKVYLPLEWVDLAAFLLLNSQSTLQAFTMGLLT